MSESKHTPGPWKVHVTDAGAVWIEETTTPERLIICDIPGDMETLGAEEHANTRLLAAAPDLLEACQEFVRKVEAGEARSARSYEQMKAAIAKALGQEGEAS